MASHVQIHCDQQSKKNMMHEICEFYLKILKDSYLEIGKTSYYRRELNDAISPISRTSSNNSEEGYSPKIL